MVNRTPVDTNKKTFFIVVSSQSVPRMDKGSMLALKSEVLSQHLE
jgi:hypothetical protein